MERQRLLAWVEERHDLQEPIAFEGVDLSQPLQAGTPLLMAGDPTAWHIRMPSAGAAALPQRWIASVPVEGLHITRQSPQELVWHEDPAERRHRCGALAQLRLAAAGDGECLQAILRANGWGAAAALVERLQDDDGIYEHGSGGVPREAPSPRRLLLAAIGHLPDERQWLEELCEPDDWDSGEKAHPVPRGEARLPGQPPAPPTWINLV